MSKILEIENCADCKDIGWKYWDEYNTPTGDAFCKIKNLPLRKHASEVPSWCPLPDKPEPITEKEVKEILEQTIFADEIAEAINAHFGVGNK